MNKNVYFHISDALLYWYASNKRDLPWRETTDPYRIWISEIILQQTRVNQGYDYYLRFIERFPSVNVLAEASEDEVLRLWQGLGYYSRARNLHKAAKQIVSNFNAVFPSNYSDILNLPGIGEYTAAAISSSAYNQPYAVVDGNVYRVLSRLFGIATPINSSKGKKEFSALAQELIDKQHPSTYNQAIMDFGALQCTPSSPKCKDCPMQNFCFAYETKQQDKFPVKENKTKVSNRYFNYLFVVNNSNTYLKKRSEKDIWAGLYEFPLIETDKILSGKELLENKEFQKLFAKSTVELQNFSSSIKHKLSHRLIEAQFISIRIESESALLKEYLRVPLNRLHEYPTSRLITLFLEQQDKKQS